MDSRLLDAITGNKSDAFISLINENEGMIEQTTVNSSNTVLHLASRFGHIELVKEIIKLRPEMVAAENLKLETPLHEACRQGNVRVLMLLLQTSPWTAYKLNSENQSPFFLASSNGHLRVVKLLLNQPWLQGLEEDENCIHVAISKGHTSVARKILDVCPDFAQKLDKNGYSPLHIACRTGNLEITQVLLRLDAEVAWQFDNVGYTPVHLAAINGKTETLQEFVSNSPTSFQYLTKQGETVFHLLVRFSHYEAFVYLAQVLHDTDIFHSPDKYGNTILHTALFSGNDQIVKYIINKTSLELNAENNKGITALDILQEDNERAKNLQLELNKLALKGKREREIKNYESASESDGLKNYQRNAQQRTKKRKKQLAELHNNQKAKREEIDREGLQNARNTIILVSILIATVTFTAGISPPGGVNQDGPFRGKSVAGRTKAFKVFVLCNNIALFLSLCIVAVLVSIIPFQRKPQMRLLVVAHKFMWVAVSFMATAYVAALWVVMPQSNGTEWVFVVALSIGGGSLGISFIGLTVLLIEHWLRKLKWRRDRKRQGEELANMRMIKIQSFNSDLESSNLYGYYSY